MVKLILQLGYGQVTFSLQLLFKWCKNYSNEIYTKCKLQASIGQPFIIVLKRNLFSILLIFSALFNDWLQQVQTLTYYLASHCSISSPQNNELQFGHCFGLYTSSRQILQAKFSGHWFNVLFAEFTVSLIKIVEI
jgi:hypothetical protein